MDERTIIEQKFDSIKKVLNGLGSSFTDVRTQIGLSQIK